MDYEPQMRLPDIDIESARTAEEDHQSTAAKSMGTSRRSSHSVRSRQKPLVKCRARDGRAVAELDK